MGILTFRCDLSRGSRVNTKENKRKEGFYLDVLRNLGVRDFLFKKQGSDSFYLLTNDYLLDTVKSQHWLDRNAFDAEGFVLNSALSPDRKDQLFDKIFVNLLGLGYENDSLEKDKIESILETIKYGFHQGSYLNSTYAALTQLCTPKNLLPITYNYFTIERKDNKVFITEVLDIKGFCNWNKLDESAGGVSITSLLQPNNPQQPEVKPMVKKLGTIATLRTTYVFDADKPGCVGLMPTKMDTYPDNDGQFEDKDDRPIMMLDRLPRSTLDCIIDFIKTILSKIFGEKLFYYTEKYEGYDERFDNNSSETPPKSRL